jgi:ABC-type polysaccharide/polyol phosphate transport system ATPase subunit
MSTDDVLLRAEGVSKKFCRDLRRSLWYGVQDTIADLTGRDGALQKLRPDEFWAVNNASFELRRGECLGLIGRNGAGKTTLLKMLNGLIKPDAGTIQLRGRVGALIALGAGFNPILTGRENIYVNGSVLGLSKREIDTKYADIVDFAGIGEFIDSPVQNYSSGMQVRLGFAIAVAVQPQILLLDEVLAVGDVNFQAKCFNTLATFRKGGTAFILVSHNMHMISRYCQKVLYLRNGEIAHAGDVTLGLSKFNNDTAMQESEIEFAGPEWTNARGSGKVRFAGGQFVNAQGAPIDTIKVGEPVSLVLRYDRADPTPAAAMLDIIIRANGATVYQGTNIASGQPFGPFFDEGQITVQFDYLPLNVPYLDFFVALLDPQTGEIYDWKRNLRLRVDQQATHHGDLVLPAKWTMHSLGSPVTVANRQAAE